MESNLLKDKDYIVTKYYVLRTKYGEYITDININQKHYSVSGPCYYDQTAPCCITRCCYKIDFDIFHLDNKVMIQYKYKNAPIQEIMPSTENGVFSQTKGISPVIDTKCYPICICGIIPWYDNQIDVKVTSTVEYIHQVEDDYQPIDEYAYPSL